MPVRYCIFDTKLGTVFAAFTSAGLCRLSVGGEENDLLAEVERAHGGPVERDDGLIRHIQRDFRSYFQGGRPVWPYELDLSALTDFQRKVINAMRRIPYGEVRTYKWIAERIGSPDAARAVGQACGANPVPVIVPCHRVVASDGIGGFGGGLDLKRLLLEIEGIAPEQYE